MESECYQGDVDCSSDCVDDLAALLELTLAPVQGVHQPMCVPELAVPAARRSKEPVELVRCTTVCAQLKGRLSPLDHGSRNVVQTDIPLIPAWVVPRRPLPTGYNARDAVPLLWMRVDGENLSRALLHKFRR